jgi:transposase
MSQGTSDTTDYKALSEQQREVINALTLKVDTLTFQLLKFSKMLFGSKSERFIPTEKSESDPQLTLGLNADTIAQCKIVDTKKIEYTRTKTEVTSNAKLHPGRHKFAEHLPRKVIRIEPDMDTSGLERIGEEITEILDVKPPEFFVLQYIRSKYVFPLEDDSTTIIMGALPGRLIDKCMISERLQAQILVDKYVDHCPLHRQQQRFERAGINFPKSTLNDSVRMGLEQLAAIFGLHKTSVLNSQYLGADETTIKVLDEVKKGKSHLGFYWIYYNLKDKLVLFDYHPGRGREGPDEILKNFKGYLQTDGYSVYEEYGKRPGITLIHCMAHARRKFTDALNNNPELADYALTRIRKLYEIEDRIQHQGLSEDVILQLRQKEAVPILKDLKDWMTDQYVKVLPKSPIGMAIAYCLPRWDRLSIYTSNAMLRIDNNLVENAIRPVALGRKNYLFAGSHESAQRAAMIYSLFATCKLHKVNPFEWLKNYFETLAQNKKPDLETLLPHKWSRPETFV